MLSENTIKRFNSYMKKYPQLYDSLAQKAQKHVSFSQPLILDIGTGSGLLLKALQLFFPKATFIGLDPQRAMLRLTRDNTKSEDVQPLLGVSEKLPVKNNTVDLVISRFSLCYWNTPQNGVTEIYRVLKPGGIVILESLNKQFPSWKLHLIAFHMFLRFAGKDVVRYHRDAYRLAYTLEQVRVFLTTAGFIILEKEGMKKEWKFTVVAQKP